MAACNRPVAKIIRCLYAVVTSFELNEHHAESDNTTPVLPTPGFTTWRSVASSGSKTGGRSTEVLRGRETEQVGLRESPGGKEEREDVQSHAERAKEVTPAEKLAGRSGSQRERPKIEGPQNSGEAGQGGADEQLGGSAHGQSERQRLEPVDGEFAQRTDMVAWSGGFAKPTDMAALSGGKAQADLQATSGIPQGRVMERVGAEGGSQARSDTKMEQEGATTDGGEKGSQVHGWNEPERSDTDRGKGGGRQHSPEADRLAPNTEVESGSQVRIEPERGSKLDLELKALIARAETLRDAMTEASKSVPAPVRDSATRLARLELPLVETEAQKAHPVRPSDPSPAGSELLVAQNLHRAEPDRERKRNRDLRATLQGITREEDGFLATRYGVRRWRRRSVLSPRGSSSDEHSDGSGFSDASESWVGADSEEDAYGVAEDELLKELFFARKDRRQSAESSDQELGAGARLPESGGLSLASSPEHASTVRISVSHMVLGRPPGWLSAPPSGCTLHLRFPVVTRAMADIAAAHPPQSMSIVPVRLTAGALVFRHSADFPVRLSDPDVQQLWRFGQLAVELCLEGEGERVTCQGRVPLEDVLRSVLGSFRASVALYAETASSAGSGSEGRLDSGEEKRLEKREKFDERASFGETKRLEDLERKLEQGVGDLYRERGGEKASLDEQGENETSTVLQSWSGEKDLLSAPGEENQGGGGLSQSGGLVGTVDIEVQLLSSGRGPKRKVADGKIAAMRELVTPDDGEDREGELLCFFVKLKSIATSLGHTGGPNKGSQFVVIAKAPKSGGRDAVLQVLGASRGFGRRTTSSQIREGVVAAPKGLAGGAVAKQEGVLVLEVWTRSHVAASDDELLGLVRVPVTPGAGRKLRGLEVLVSERAFEIWDPLTSRGRGALTLSVLLGSQNRVRELVREEAAVLRIQRFFRGSADRRQFQAMLAAKQQRALEKELEGACVEHTFRVTVVGATGLPAGGSLYQEDAAHGSGRRTEREPLQAVEPLSSIDTRKRTVTFSSKTQPSSAGVKTPEKQPSSAHVNAPGKQEVNGCRFIKYWFPKETEPLYTRNVDWTGSPQFRAQALHSITLPVGEGIGDHLGAGLRFEVWDKLEGAQGGEESRVGTAELKLSAFLDLEGRSRVGNNEVSPAFPILFSSWTLGGLSYVLRVDR